MGRYGEIWGGGEEAFSHATHFVSFDWRAYIFPRSMPADYVRAAMGIEESHKELESKRQAASWSAPRMIGFLVVIAATYSLAAHRTSDVLPLQTPPFLPCGWTATRRLLIPPLGCADQVNRSACVQSFVAAPDRLYIHACHWAGGDGDGEAPPRCVALQRQRLLCSFQQSRAARGRGRGNRSQGGGRLRGHPSAAQHHGHSGGGGVGRLTPGVCRDMLAAGPGSRFYGMWGRRAWCARQEGEEACWGGGARAEQWFARVEAGAACERDWGVPPAAPAVLGFSDTTLKYCNARLGEGWVARGEHRERCRRCVPTFSPRYRC